MSLTFDQYAEAAAGTAIYPEIKRVDAVDNPFSSGRLTYPALGLCGEAGEVAELIKKMHRDDNGCLTLGRREKLKKELGDVLWYLAEISRQAGLNLSEVASANIEKLRARQAAGTIHCDGSDR
jgi:NTP pyrophosphatase (non-canonical NTP hydrolase)